MNTVVLIGNLASEVELREVSPDRRVASFLLAVDRPGDGKADFVKITTWDHQADACGAHLGKGHRVGVGGRLRQRSWQDADGNRRSAIEVVANTVDFLSPKD
jgi:single-strand DNA-binding protein